ncbi:response regulator [Metabacillus litoralis]|uniref:Response regulator n=1 Tax=Metabacillus litoralis TaxID=152268 RepID=A0A5C6VZ18_9BACI|nr:response regulator [Metabacillus litoralis]TXC90810.1 response regulator [Metabacillus litoralis]
MNSIWKVLIADDEPIIREGIRQSVEWSSFNMFVEAEAEDGEEALELALKYSVNIILVDLNMPIMNGLSLIKKIREQLPLCKIIIITGHDEFTYAQEALRLNVTDYILKPVEPNKLNEVLDQVVEELESDTKQDEFLEMASRQIENNLSILREQFFNKWINGTIKNRESIINQLKFFDLPLSSPKHILVIQCPEYVANKPLLSDKDKKILLFSIENITSEVFDHCSKVSFRDETDLIIVLLWDSISENLYNIVKMKIKEYLKISINIYIENIENDIASIAEGYENCKKKLVSETTISPIVRRARQYIEKNFTDSDITIEQVADNLQVSPVYLGRIIKQDLGTSFVSLVTNLRIKEAIMLLNNTDLPIVQIAEEVGYDTQHYFSTAFKKVVGVSPNKYRKNPTFINE